MNYLVDNRNKLEGETTTWTPRGRQQHDLSGWGGGGGGEQHFVFKISNMKKWIQYAMMIYELDLMVYLNYTST